MQQKYKWNEPGETTGMVEGSCGIKTMTRRNQKHIELKMRNTISQLYDIRHEENLRQHVEICRQLPGYEPIHFEHNGKWYQVTPGPAAIDGAGKERSYNHRITGNETALIVQSGVTGRVPLELVHSQVSSPGYVHSRYFI